MEKTISYTEVIKGYILRCAGLMELDENTDIFESGIVNSLFIIQLMTFLERDFKIKITMEDLDISNFKSVKTIASFVTRKVSRVN
ncbi:hypothetical protein A3860_05165 [Niastella vici]|uniref:Carrier domain-containing protein n=1 Tax=Niastella vici TaxID=1703345 RepID=A0A1V9FRU1_9BACT|nr:phosphopantetheine-binding protein [Niastella vici]OQP61109.1 hypothetical protein A3860_05165 [Niastella vici]